MAEADLISYYQHARAVLFIHEEDFGLVPLEAHAAGTPVIGINKGGVAETVIHGQTGLLLDSVADLKMLFLTLIPLNSTGNSSSHMPKSLPKTDSKENLSKHLYVLILAGGGGTRLWPLSRENSPKQFIKLFSGQSLLQLTVDRALKLTPPNQIYISTSAKYVAEIKNNVPK